MLLDYKENLFKEILNFLEPENCFIIFSNNKLKFDNKKLRFKHFTMNKQEKNLDSNEEKIFAEF